MKRTIATAILCMAFFCARAQTWYMSYKNCLLKDRATEMPVGAILGIAWKKEGGFTSVPVSVMLGHGEGRDITIEKFLFDTVEGRDGHTVVCMLLCRIDGFQGKYFLIYDASVKSFMESSTGMQVDKGLLEGRVCLDHPARYLNDKKKR